MVEDGEAPAGDGSATLSSVGVARTAAWSPDGI
jgi:hypothetical protein